MKIKKFNNLAYVLALLSEAMERAESLHCMCKQCETFRADGTGDDLCFAGRKVMQVVYACDVAMSLTTNTIAAGTWEDLQAVK